ncbi:DUF3489 domain-containing protein [uncultured Sphingomonas sp.]|uniref:DUF3489 domain-containing protein n=1 Tax=uncultured Sphingomonas sp. TaxID=158754 RepID=UPI0025ECEA28|nr:DUF3489 domain-containing protein [uncultured Sphingomonas sp.]
MPKLNDTQSILLSTAAQRDSGSLHPLPAILNPAGARVGKAIASLVALAMLEERETSDIDCIARTEGDLSFGLYITPAGLTAIGIEPAEAAPVDADDDAPEPASPAPAPAPARVIKSALVLELLQREGGASMAELTSATGWLPHTMRAALTGLRKKGHEVARGKRDDMTCYTVVVAA